MVLLLTWLNFWKKHVLFKPDSIRNLSESSERELK